MPRRERKNNQLRKELHRQRAERWHLEKEKAELQTENQHLKTKMKSIEGETSETVTKNSRRSFLAIGIKGGLAALGAAAIGKFSYGVVQSYSANHIPLLSAITSRRGFSTDSSEKPDPDLAKRIVGLVCSPTSVTANFYGGADHYLVLGKTHPDNAVIENDLIATVRQAGVVETVDMDSPSLLLDEYQGDLVLIGSPSSNALSRDIFNKVPPKQLRYTYEFEDRLVDLMRFQADGTLQSQCKFTAIRDRKHDTLHYPDEGWLEQDFLLVTRIPRKTEQGYRYVTIIGGTHGLGTRGVNLLLQNPEFLERIRVSPEGGFQLLAAVEARNEGNRSEPTKAAILHSEPIHIV